MLMNGTECQWNVDVAMYGHPEGIAGVLTVYYFTALHSCSAKFRYGNKCWSAWSKPNWNSLAQTLEPEYDPGEVTGGLWVGPSQTYARPV